MTDETRSVDDHAADTIAQPTEDRRAPAGELSDQDLHDIAGGKGGTGDTPLPTPEPTYPIPDPGERIHQPHPSCG